MKIRITKNASSLYSLRNVIEGEEFDVKFNISTSEAEHHKKFYLILPEGRNYIAVYEDECEIIN